MFYLFSMEPRRKKTCSEHFIQEIRVFLYFRHNLHVDTTTSLPQTRQTSPFLKRHQRNRRVKKTQSSFSQPNTPCPFLYFYRLLRLTCKSHRTSPSR